MTTSSSDRPPPPEKNAAPAKGRASAKGAAPAPDARPVKAPRGPLIELGTGAAWIIGLGAACQMAVVALHSNPLAVVMVQAVVVDLAASRAGLKWDPVANDDTSVERQDAVRGIGFGLGAALAVIAVALGVSAAFGWAVITVHGPTTSLALGGMRSIAIGVRDAQLFAGLPLFFVARAKGVPKLSAPVFSALLGGAAIALMPAATPANVALAGAVTCATAALWYRDGAGWAAVGLAGGWAFLAGALFRGGLVDVAWKKGALAPGVVADGGPAWITAALFVALAVVAVRTPRGAASTPRDSSASDETSASDESSAPRDASASDESSAPRASDESSDSDDSSEPRESSEPRDSSAPPAS